MASSNPSSNPTVSDLQRAVKDTVHSYWQLFLTQGVIMVILGILAVVWPQISTVAVDVYVGWLFLLSGIVGIFTMFLARDVQAFLWMLLTAALSLFVGIVLLWHPVEGAVSLTLVLIALFIVEGVISDCGIPKLSRRVSRIVGLDVGEWDRRSDPRRPDHQGMAKHGHLGTGADRRHQSHHVGRRHYHGGASRTKPRENVSQRAPIGVKQFIIAGVIHSEREDRNAHSNPTYSDSWNSGGILPRSPGDR